jgi:hypothetical protein
MLVFESAFRPRAHKLVSWHWERHELLFNTTLSAAACCLSTLRFLLETFRYIDT